MFRITFLPQAGALDPIEVAEARMDFDLECSGYNVRQFLGTFSAQSTLDDSGNAVMSDILALVDEVEQQTDAVLDGDNEEGWELFRSKIGVCARCLANVRYRLACLTDLLSPLWFQSYKAACNMSIGPQTSPLK